MATSEELVDKIKANLPLLEEEVLQLPDGLTEDETRKRIRGLMQEHIGDVLGINLADLA